MPRNEPPASLDTRRVGHQYRSLRLFLGWSPSTTPGPEPAHILALHKYPARRRTGGRSLAPEIHRKNRPFAAISSPLVDSYLQSATLVTPHHLVGIAPDPDDDVVIGTALAAKANLIVTGDRGLLSVERYHDIRIVSVAEVTDSIFAKQ